MPGNTESSQEHVPDHADDTVPTRQGDELVRTDRGSISPEIRRPFRDDQVFAFWSCLEIPRKVGSYVCLGIGNVLVYPYVGGVSMRKKGLRAKVVRPLWDHSS